MNMKKLSAEIQHRNERPIRSPLFYVGDKYKLMPQLNYLFPKSIGTFFDVFCGGGSASINAHANLYVMNDINEKIIELHSFLQKNSNDMDRFIERLQKTIEGYGLSLSDKRQIDEIEKLKKVYKKTYYAKYNKEAYLRLREDYNKSQDDTSLLYLLLIYGFNHMLRYNSKGEFNLPVGNVDWNKNVTMALKNYGAWYNNSKVVLSKPLDFEGFVENQNPAENDFFYFDPPYLITFSEYNKLWNETEEKRLYDLLDRLTKKGVKWGLSNMVSHKGKTNELLIEWSKQYTDYAIKSNYISRFDNTIKADSKEIYVANY